MMEQERFDDLARLLALGASRRKLLRGLIGGLGGGMLALFHDDVAALPNCPANDPDCVPGPAPTIPPIPTTPPCPASQVLCGGECVDLATDPLHCGSCGTACSSGSCEAGTCITYCSCAAGLLDCGPNNCTNQRCTFNHGECDALQCVDVQSDPNNCFTCGVVCPAGWACCDRVCQDLSSESHCGACGNACPTDGYWGCCDGACVDLSQPEHCAACTTACQPGELCMLDENNNGACVCPDGQTSCGGRCVDLTADPAHCGACGIACAKGVACVNGACAAASNPTAASENQPPTTTPAPSAKQTPVAGHDKWALWSGGTHLRGANVWQRRVYPEVDGPRAMGPGPVGPPFSPQDFDQLAAWGANYVHISHPGLFVETAPYDLDPAVQENLDRLLGWIAEANLFAVIAFRTGPGRSEFTFSGRADDASLAAYANDAVWKEKEARAAWVAMWHATAERYRHNPIVVGYDLMVGPNANDVGDNALEHPLGIDHPTTFYQRYRGTRYDWNRLYPRFVTAIREVDPDTPILVGGMGYSAAEWLPYLEPIGDARTVYTVRQHEPLAYTRQLPSRPLAYPSDADIDGNGVNDQFNRTWLVSLLHSVDEFTGHHDRPIAMTEFGVARWAPGAASFIADQIDLFEQRGLNHALWEWSPSRAGQAKNDAANIRHGPDPAHHTDVESSDLIDAIRTAWARNTARPSPDEAKTTNSGGVGPAA